VCVVSAPPLAGTPTAILDSVSQFGCRSLQVPDFTFVHWKESGVANFSKEAAAVVRAGKRRAKQPNVCGWAGNPHTHKAREHFVKLADKSPFLEAHIPPSWDHRAGTRLSSTDIVAKWGCLVDLPGRGYSGRIPLLLFSGRPLLLVQRPDVMWYTRQDWRRPWGDALERAAVEMGGSVPRGPLFGPGLAVPVPFVPPLNDTARARQQAWQHSGRLGRPVVPAGAVVGTVEERPFGPWQAWVHYVPVRADLSDLEAKARWVAEHGAEAGAMAARAQRLASEWLTLPAAVAFLARELRAAAAARHEPDEAAAGL